MVEPIKFDSDNYQITEFFDELPLWSAPFGLTILDNIDYKNNISVLDIGFGCGFPVIEIAMRLGSDSKIYGIDPWSAGIDRVRKKISYYGLRNIEIIEGNAESMPLTDNSIELIVSNNGINNVADMNQVFNQCYRILKPNGRILFTMNTNQTMIEFYQIFEKVLQNSDLNSAIEKMHEHITMKRPSKELVINLLNQNNFQKISIEERSFDLKFSNGSTMLQHYFIRLAFLESWLKIIPENIVDSVFKKLENELNIYSNTKGYLNLSVPYYFFDVEK